MMEYMARKQSNRPKARPLKLDGRTASRVRRSFGIDPVRLELGESEAVRAMGTRAVAKGNVIQFAPGEFSPETPKGRQVLGHELAHVRSQARGEVPMTGGVLERPGLEAAAPAQMKKPKSCADKIRGPQLSNSKESAILSEKLYQMLLPHLDDEEVQKDIKEMFANSGGNLGSTRQGPEEFFLTDVLARLVGVVNGQYMRGENIDSINLQREKYKESLTNSQHPLQCSTLPLQRGLINYCSIIQGGEIYADGTTDTGEEGRGGKAASIG